METISIICSLVLKSIWGHISLFKESVISKQRLLHLLFLLLFWLLFWGWTHRQVNYFLWFTFFDNKLWILIWAIQMTRGILLAINRGAIIFLISNFFNATLIIYNFSMTLNLMYWVLNQRVNRNVREVLNKFHWIAPYTYFITSLDREGFHNWLVDILYISIFSQSNWEISWP
jgi:hypothetical protein